MWSWLMRLANGMGRETPGVAVDSARSSSLDIYVYKTTQQVAMGNKIEPVNSWANFLNGKKVQPRDHGWWDNMSEKSFFTGPRRQCRSDWQQKALRTLKTEFFIVTFFWDVWWKFFKSSNNTSGLIWCSSFCVAPSAPRSLFCQSVIKLDQETRLRLTVNHNLFLYFEKAKTFKRVPFFWPKSVN